MQHAPSSRRAERAANIVAGVVGAIALCIAAGWAVFLPIFLSPDEDSHYDYALTLFTAGRPMRPAENDVGRDTHPSVAYLIAATHARQQRLDEALPADPGYGTPAYYRGLDAGAPHVDARRFANGPIDPVPYISRLYPIGYYALAALAIGVGDKLTHGSVVGQFFFARFLSVALLVSTLSFTWLALRQLALSRRKALAFFTCTALLPMTAWMAGYVQPDNLVCALVAPILYLALRMRRRPDDTRLLAVAGMLLGLLMATKQQYFLALYVPIVAMLAVRLPYRISLATGRSLAWLTAPAVAAYFLTEPFLRAAPGGGGLCKLGDPLATARSLGPWHVVHFYTNGIETTLRGAFLPGTGLESFWLSYTAYRNELLVLGTPELTQVVAALLAPLGLVLVMLFLVRAAGAALRLARIARRRSLRSAARIATSNVLVNAYLCYFAILLGFEVTSGGFIPVQGRYWLPVVSAVWILAVTVAPRAFPARFARPLGSLVLALVLGFVVVASVSTFPSIHARFYGPRKTVEAHDELLGDVEATVAADEVRFTGSSMDLRDASPTQRAALQIDGAAPIETRRVARPDIQCDMEQTLLQSGFETAISRSKLARGTHTVKLLAQTPWTGQFVDTGDRATFVIP